VLAALVPAYAIAILMPAGPDDGCPSPRQVDDALSAHLPGMVLPLGHSATGPTTLHLAVTTDASGALRLDLTDPDGGPLLHRWLSAVERTRGGGDCPALAETAALIVERYWHEVGYDVAVEAPPAPPPPTPPAPAEKTGAKPLTPRPAPRAPLAMVEAGPSMPSPLPPAPLPPARWWIGAAGGGRLGDAGTRQWSASLAFTVEHAVPERRVGLRLSAGTDPSVTYEWSPAAGTTDHATLRQFPIRMGAYLAVPLGPGQLEPGLGLDLEVISAATTDPSGTRTRLSAGPGLDAALGWAILFRPNLYFRLLALAGTEVPYHFVTTPNQSPFSSTPRVYLDLGLELGLWFP
jgi:hypothetical protein